MAAIDFDLLCDTLTAAGAHDTSPAEIHGLACGILAAGFPLSAEQWLAEVAAYLNEEHLTGDAMPLIELFSSSHQQMTEDGFALQLCLPDDDIYGICERSNSLGVWCQGFLHGFAAVQAGLSDDSQALLKDLTEISKLEMTESDIDPDSDEDNERDYAELSEFVRMAAMSLFMDYSDGLADTAGTPH